MADAIDDGALWYGYDVEAAKSGNANTGVNATTRTPSNTLDKDAFLQLLITQLQYQDPLQPMDNSQMVQQMSQFSMVEQMENMAKSFSHAQAYGLIGKTVYANVMNDSTGLYEEVIGEVTGIKIKSGEPVLMVGDKEVPVNKVELVFSDNLANSIKNLNSNLETDQTLSLIGKFVQAITYTDGVATGFIEGQVDYIKFDSNGRSILVIGTEEVYATEVTSVASEKRLLDRKIKGAYTEGSLTDYVTGTITGVKIRDGKAYLQVLDDETGKTKEVNVKNVALTSDALAYVGKTVNFNGTSGVVASITVKSDGVPYMILADSGKEINFANFKGVKLDEEEE